MAAAVRRAAARGLRIRPVGTGHSWSPLAVTGDVQLDCRALTGVVTVAGDRVRVRAGATLESLYAELAEHGRTLAVIPDAGGLTVAGAIGTGTHSSGAATGSLSAQVTGARMVDGTGSVRWVEGPDLDAVRTGLGALGVLTEVELRTVPMRLLQVHEDSGDPTELLADGGMLDAHAWTEVVLHLPSREALARWGDPVEPGLERESGRRDLVRAAAAGSAEALGRVVSRLTPTLRRTARWGGSVTGPAYRVLIDRRPVRGEAAEWALPRERLGPALRELGAAAAARRIELRSPVLVRVGPAETGWLHPAWGRATAWVALRGLRGADPGPLFALAGAVLTDAGGRPHWAGRHEWTLAEVALAYPRLADFQAARDRFDPDRRFACDHLDALLGP
ncbi:FAD-linked oxidoreductase [Pseudonocardia asaccharolytica DSM 44247 = NBRC 16224]|uniref:FAD-linked oxidoreductase n=1 Tax=Pseudonocardia asaccharolytica DSM 44247 = NBRC 16224 TaxID=1123024 RepID=A0A511D9N7_9PSEU|nr:FAD-linked oxidoreductase [Pseudonocardia asaccharolytica DSM 44247 = NBRC 16224]